MSLAQSCAWEVTEDDVAAVLARHGIGGEDVLEEAVEAAMTESDRIIGAVLYYCNFDDQVEAGLAEIEDVLIEECIIPAGAEKVFFAP